MDILGELLAARQSDRKKKYPDADSVLAALRLKERVANPMSSQNISYMQHGRIRAFYPVVNIVNFHTL